MGYQDLDRRVQEEETSAEFASLIETLTTDKVVLIDEKTRNKLKGTQTTINHFRDTPSGFGVIETVDFTLLDGVTFMWDRRHPAAVAYGRIHGQDKLILTGGIFYSGSLRRAGVDPSMADFLPESIAEIPGYANQFRNSLAFRISDVSSNTLNLTFGGMYPDSRTSTQIFGLNKHLQVINHLDGAVKSNIPRI